MVCSALESDRLAVLAARRAVVTVEGIVPDAAFVARPGEVFLSALHIDLVVVAPQGAHPGACVNMYGIDRAQIDRKGNLNLTCIGPYDAPKVRLPGGAGSAMLYYMTLRVVLFTLAQSPRLFVEKCDFVTSAASTPHYPWRRGGPTRLITPLCTMEFDSQGR